MNFDKWVINQILRKFFYITLISITSDFLKWEKQICETDNLLFIKILHEIWMQSFIYRKKIRINLKNKEFNKNIYILTSSYIYV